MQRSKIFGPRAVTANYLDSGVVAFLTADGWNTNIANITVATDEGAAAVLLARAETDAARNLVLNPYLIEMAETPRGWRPTALRELIRAFGPPVETKNTDMYVQA